MKPFTKSTLLMSKLDFTSNVSFTDKLMQEKSTDWTKDEAKNYSKNPLSPLYITLVAIITN